MLDYRKIALVTGALGGIGTAICRQLIQHQYKIIAVLTPSDENREEKWLQTEAIHPQDIRFLAVDINDHQAVIEGIEHALDTEGRIDLLVNNAGITQDSAFKKMSYAQWCAVLDTNLRSLYSITHPVFLRMLAQNDGRIINITSVNGLRGQFGQTNYSAAKAGMIGFTKALALEGARNRVCVNAIAPGYTATPMVNAMKVEVLDGIKQQIPLNRLALPEEIAAAVVFLASDHSGYITGETLSINGGLHMH
ncbi:acetoacetyl-CoA reductase [Snodgrassella sp. CFCC 13594]|uniref:acetoacetyl-CoA reductase n=1 Tax=Snodgrassella sp. CFCC 13594 TaxID=1775559 RepID=UPI00082B01B9|nr:acetoacetyl-CoA reductase [Snodgrassella sp. CFCC 13594]